MPRSDVSILAAACIVSVSLIVSAVIVVHRPAASGSVPASVSADFAKPTGTPPIAQASVQEQFRAQVLAAPTLHSYRFDGKTYTLTDIKVDQVVYTAKDDSFAIFYSYTWQPAMPADGPQSSGCDLNNDGYGHYYGTASLSSPVDENGQNVDVTIK